MDPVALNQSYADGEWITSTYKDNLKEYSWQKVLPRFQLEALDFGDILPNGKTWKQQENWYVAQGLATTTIVDGKKTWCCAGLKEGVPHKRVDTIRHLREHEFPQHHRFGCPFPDCPYDAKQKNHIVTHINGKHAVARFVCLLCPGRPEWHDPSWLNRHAKAEHGREFLALEEREEPAAPGQSAKRKQKSMEQLAEEAKAEAAQAVAPGNDSGYELAPASKKRKTTGKSSQKATTQEPNPIDLTASTPAPAATFGQQESNPADEFDFSAFPTSYGDSTQVETSYPSTGDAGIWENTTANDQPQFADFQYSDLSHFGYQPATQTSADSALWPSGTLPFHDTAESFIADFGAAFPDPLSICNEVDPATLVSPEEIQSLLRDLRGPRAVSCT